MTSETKNVYYLFKQGAVQEEPWEWSDLEAMCRDGRLSPDSLIFIPDENEWRKASETDLAPLIDQVPGAGDDDEAQAAAMREGYERALEHIEQNPELLVGLLNAAEIAAAMGNHEAAWEHYQRALQQHPYHPRAVQEAKKNLLPADWVRLRYLNKPPSIWHRVESIFTYPLSRGPLYVVIPGLVLGGLWWLPGGALVGGVILYLWAIQVIRAAGLLEPRPPLWHRLLSEPKEALAKPLWMAVVIGAELYLPFLVFGQIFAATGTAPNALTAIQSSPFLIVGVFTVSLVYLPAVLVLGTSPVAAMTSAFNPLQVVKMIGKMDKEYMAAAGYIVLMFCLWGMINLGLERIPVAGRIIATLLGVYVMLTSGLVLGRLQARFKEQITG